MKRRLNKHIILIVLLLISLFLFSFLFLRIYQRDQQNLNYRYLQHQFDPDANTARGSDQYLERVPMEDMDFAALGIDAAYAPLGYKPYTLTVTLSEDVTYYREVMGVKIPALAIRDTFSDGFRTLHRQRERRVYRLTGGSRILLCPPV